MKDHKLLYGAKIRVEPFKRNFIRFRTLKPDYPLQYLSMDIKYVHVHGSARNALLLTVIDVYTRKVPIHTLRFSIKKGDVLLMLSLMLLEYKTEVVDRYEFDSIYHAQMVFDRYYKWYNEKRRHGSLGRKTPELVWNNYFNPFP